MENNDSLSLSRSDIGTKSESNLTNSILMRLKEGTYDHSLNNDSTCTYLSFRESTMSHLFRSNNINSNISNRSRTNSDDSNSSVFDLDLDDDNLKKSIKKVSNGRNQSKSPDLNNILDQSTDSSAGDAGDAVTANSGCVWKESVYDVSEKVIPENITNYNKLLRAPLNYIPPKAKMDADNMEVGELATETTETTETNIAIISKENPEILHDSKGPDSLNWWGIRRDPILFDVITKMHEADKRRVDMDRKQKERESTTRSSYTSTGTGSGSGSGGIRDVAQESTSGKFNDRNKYNKYNSDVYGRNGGGEGTAYQDVHKHNREDRYGRYSCESRDYNNYRDNYSHNPFNGRGGYRNDYGPPHDHRIDRDRGSGKGYDYDYRDNYDGRSYDNYNREDYSRSGSYNNNYRDNYRRNSSGKGYDYPGDNFGRISMGGGGRGYDNNYGDRNDYDYGRADNRSYDDYRSGGGHSSYRDNRDNSRGDHYSNTSSGHVQSKKGKKPKHDNQKKHKQMSEKQVGKRKHEGEPHHDHDKNDEPNSKKKKKGKKKKK